MIGFSILEYIICKLVTSNLYLDFSLIYVITSSVSLLVKVSISLEKHCRLLVVDNLPWTAIEHCNKLLNKKTYQHDSNPIHYYFSLNIFYASVWMDY